MVYFLAYVDDLILTGSDSQVVNHIIGKLDATFSTKDLALLSFFCGVEVIPNPTGVLLSQNKYIVDLLSKHNKLDSKLCLHIFQSIRLLFFMMEHLW